MGTPMDYGVVAPTNADHRWALPWKLQPLLDAVGQLVDHSGILEVGCGTGDYLHALHDRAPHHRYRGFDISPDMLAQARSRCPWAALAIGNADVSFPADSDELGLVYAVDVLHHLQDYDRFSGESVRVLRNGARLVVITDSEDDIPRRSLAELFPATVPVNLGRYPAIEDLLDCAAAHGFHFAARRSVRGYMDLDDRFMSALAAKALSELRLIPDSEYQRGMRRAEESRALGGRWLSQTTVVEWTLPWP